MLTHKTKAQRTPILPSQVRGSWHDCIGESAEAKYRNRVAVLQDFCGTSMFKYSGKGKNKLSWETGEGLTGKGSFHECPDLSPPPLPFQCQCLLTFEGLKTLGNYLPPLSISVRSQSYRLGKSRQNPTKCLFGFILLVCFWNSRSLGCPCQYLHLLCPDVADGLWDPFPLIPDVSSEFFSPFFLLW